MATQAETPREASSGTVGEPERTSGTAREAILEATRAIIRESGVDAVRVTEVSRRAGYTTGALYGCFRDRSDLVAQALADEFASRTELDLNLLGEQLLAGGANLADSLRSVLRDILSTDRDEMRAGRIEAFVAARRNPEVRDALAGELQRQVADTEQAVKLAQALGIVRSDIAAEAVAALALAMPLGMAIVRSFGAYASPELTEVIAEGALEVFANGAWTQNPPGSTG